jgi:hypothetical protein
MGKSKREWLVPLTGIGFVVIALVSFVLQGDTPGTDDSAKKVAEFFDDNSTKLMIGAALQALAGTLYVFFAAYLRKVLRAAEGEGGILSAAAFGGALIFVTGLAADATLVFGMADAAEDLPPAALQTMNGIYSGWFLPMAAGLIVFLWSVAISILRHGALPKWLGWLTLAMAIVAVTPIGFFVFLAMAIWIPLVAILLSLRERAAVAA